MLSIAVLPDWSNFLSLWSVINWSRKGMIIESKTWVSLIHNYKYQSDRLSIAVLPDWLHWQHFLNRWSVINWPRKGMIIESKTWLSLIHT